MDKNQDQPTLSEMELNVVRSTTHLTVSEPHLDGLWVQPYLEAEQPRVRNEHLSRVVCDRPLRKYTRRQPPGARRHARGGGVVHACVAQLCAEVRQIA